MEELGIDCSNPAIVLTQVRLSFAGLLLAASGTLPCRCLSVAHSTCDQAHGLAGPPNWRHTWHQAAHAICIDALPAIVCPDSPTLACATFSSHRCPSGLAPCCAHTCLSCLAPAPPTHPPQRPAATCPTYLQEMAKAFANLQSEADKFGCFMQATEFQK